MNRPDITHSMRSRNWKKNDQRKGRKKRIFEGIEKKKKKKKALGRRRWLELVELVDGDRDIPSAAEALRDGDEISSPELDKLRFSLVPGSCSSSFSFIFCTTAFPVAAVAVIRPHLPSDNVARLLRVVFQLVFSRRASPSRPVFYMAVPKGEKKKKNRVGIRTKSIDGMEQASNERCMSLLGPALDVELG